MKGFGIYVQNDLLEPKHHDAMGRAIWLYLWCLDKMTSIKEDGTGIVLGGKPIKLEEIQKDLSLTDRTYTRYIVRLQEFGYISTVRTPYGYTIKVTKAKKQFGKRTVKVAGRTVTLAGENRKSGGNKEDNTVDNTNTLSELRSGGDLLDNKKYMGWNPRADDYEEGVVDYDGDGTVQEEEKPRAKKYPNAQVVIKLFLEILGVNQSFWRRSPAILEACERLYTEKGVDKIRNALEFYKEHKDEKFCPKITSPKKLEEKYADLSLYKTNHES
jgi:Mn-dependent DtxR family transcriptional regulator